VLYIEIMKHSQSLISEGVNLAHKLLRQRARPKILLCETYEEAWELYEKYHENILGIILDMQFPREGKSDPEAGIAFARNVLDSYPDIPVLVQSREPENRAPAEQLGATFLLKGSPTLLSDLRSFISEKFAFGDFVFRLPSGTEVGRAKDLHSLENLLAVVPAESIKFHGERNHFSNWLKARTEFLLAYKLRPRKVEDYSSMDELRGYLISSIRDMRHAQRRGTIVDFDPATFDASNTFGRIGGGSLGGKGRGLAFVNTMISTYLLQDRFDRIHISVPPAVVIGSDVFDEFISDNSLREIALMSSDDDEIDDKFLEADFSPAVADLLLEYLQSADYPLAVRSSSLLEDSQYQPFAGIYRTEMIPNNHRDIGVRLEELLCAIKRVYASTFHAQAKSYIKATPYRLEEEKMAVIVQKLVGKLHGTRFYPDFAGVASSRNFYPIAPMTAEDGIVAVALGLGPTVLEGGRAVRFSPKYPQSLIQFSTVEDMLENSQRGFYALELPSPESEHDHRREVKLVELGLDVAEKDGTLAAVASTYSMDNQRVYDGLSRDGARIVSFAPILKHDYFPLPEVVKLILKFASRGMSGPVEIEFAANLNSTGNGMREFSVLQLRPMVIAHESEELNIAIKDEGHVICRSNQVLGDGLLDSVRDIVYVDAERYDRAVSHEVAREIEVFNRALAADGTPYVLLGVGRWGCADPWLGIPVAWDQISGARVIVEAGFKDMRVTPSQGTHFFQNLLSFRIGYFTVDSKADGSFVDWQWLAAQLALSEKKFARHLRFDDPMKIVMNGRTQEGVIIKPGPP